MTRFLERYQVDVCAEYRLQSAYEMSLDTCHSRGTLNSYYSTTVGSFCLTSCLDWTTSSPPGPLMKTFLVGR